MDGFLVQQPFADLIAQGIKTWELRTSPVHLPRNRPFYILSTARPHPIAPRYPGDRLGRIVGVARCTDILGPMSVDEVTQHREKHLIDTRVLARYARGRKLYAMVLLHAEPVEPARRYTPKQGAVTIIANVS